MSWIGCEAAGRDRDHCCETGCGDPPTVSALDRDNVEHARCGVHVDDAIALRPLRGSAAFGGT